MTIHTSTMHGNRVREDSGWSKAWRKPSSPGSNKRQSPDLRKESGLCVLIREIFPECHILNKQGEIIMKPRLKPRNPLVAPAKFRKAGAHEKTVKARRRQDKLALLRAIKQGAELWQQRNSRECAAASASRRQSLSGISGLRACLKNRRMPFDSAGRHQGNPQVNNDADTGT